MVESKGVKKEAAELNGPPTKEEMDKIVSDIFEKDMLPKDAIGIPDDVMEGIYAHAYRTYNVGKYHNAAQLFRLLIMLNALEPKYVLGLAACHHLLGQYDNALMMYMVVEVLNPKDPMPNYHSADCYIRIEMQEDALEQMQKALTKCGELPQYTALKNRIIVTIAALVKQVADIKRAEAEEALSEKAVEKKSKG